MNSSPEKTSGSGKGKQKDDVPNASSSSVPTALQASTSSAVPPPPVQYSDILRELILERARNLLIARWVCDGDGHAVCFVDALLHRCMTKTDIDAWAHEIYLANTSVHQPPASLLVHWQPADIPVALAQLSYPSVSEQAVSIYSLTSSNLDIASEQSEQSAFYHVGSAIKGIGNIIIGGISKADIIYRRRRLRGLLKTVKIIYRRYDHVKRKEAFSKLVMRLLAPSNQLHWLLDEIVESNSHKVDELVMLGYCLRSNKIAMTAYMRLKWAFILARAFIPAHPIFQMTRPLICNCNSEEDSLRYAARRLQRMYLSCEERWEYHVLLLLGASRPVDFVGSALRPNTWFSALNMVALPYNFKSSIISHQLQKLHKIHVEDERMELDPDPRYGPSLWGEICNSMSLQPTVINWDQDLQDRTRLVAGIMDILAHVHPARRGFLRRANVVAQTLDSLPDESEIWGAVSDLLERQNPVLHKMATGFKSSNSFAQEGGASQARESDEDAIRKPENSEPGRVFNFHTGKWMEYFPRTGMHVKKLALHMASELEK